jgi:Tfp pilus assembly PilM family ATPase/Tfp pilus assembly protein PilN
MMEIFLGLEILDQKVRYIVVEKNGKGISFRQSGESTLQVGPSAPGALSSFIKGLAVEQGLKISRVFLTLNRRDIVIHQMNLAKISKSDLEIIIPAEIEKISSFADREFDYIYHEYDTDNNKAKIVFAAITDELLKYLLKEVEETHIPCRELEISPLNLTGLLLTPEFKEGVQGLVTVSQNTTQLLIFENQQIKYFYSTTIGQDSLFPPDLGKIERQAASSWGEEIKRVFKSYSLENRQEQVDKIWLLWDRAAAPAFDSYLSKELNLNTQPLNILPDWSGEELNPIYLLAVVPILYHIGNIKPQFSLNHFFISSQLQRYVRQMAVAALIFMCVSGLVFGGMIFHFNQTQQKAQIQLQEAQARIAKLEKGSPDLFKVQKDYIATRNQLLFQATYVKLLNRMSWSEALSVVASELPEELSLTSFKVDEAGMATFTGEALRMESIAKLLRKVDTSVVLENGKFNYLTQEEVSKTKVFRFGILAHIKQGEET